MNVGEKIKKIRKMAGMTQEELAEKMNVSRQTISKWEKEISSPDLESAIVLCELFVISLDDFLKGRRKNFTAGYDKNKPEEPEDDNFIAQRFVFSYDWSVGRIIY